MKPSKEEKKKRDIEWHNQVCEKNRVGTKYACQCKDCLKKGKLWPRNYVCGHHIKGKKAHPKLRWDPDNGICTCKAGHTKHHTGIKMYPYELLPDL